MLWVFLPAAWGQDGQEPASQGELTVRVVNGTVNGLTVVDDLVSVRIHHGADHAHDLQGRVNEQGEVVFTEIPTGSEVIAVISVRHDGTLFRGRSLALKGPNPTFSTNVVVHDSSPDDSRLTVSIHHIILRRLPEVLEVSEYIHLINPTDRVVKPDKTDDQDRNIILSIMLPPGHTNFQAQSYFHMEDLVFTEEGFYDTLSIAPGEYDLRFSYHLPLESEALTFSKKITLPTKECTLFLALLQAVPSGLPPSEGRITFMDNSEAEYFNFGAMDRDAAVEFQLSGFVLTKKDTSTWYILIGVFTLIVIVALIRVMRQRTPAPAGESPPSSPPDLSTDKTESEDPSQSSDKS